MRLTATGAYARPQPVPKMPAGLVELMEDLTRNVLRHNPADVYQFCAAHMEKLLEIRDGRALKPVLTLEQKIARVQEKMNRKAELRRQKYDKQMQLYRLNNALEQTSEQQDDQMIHSNDVKDKPTNSSETHFTQLDGKTKQSITDVLNEHQNVHSNIDEYEYRDSVGKSYDQEPDIRSNVEIFIPESDEEEIKELKNTDFGRVIDMNSECAAETKDSVAQDSDNQNKSEEPITEEIDKPTNSFETHSIQTDSKTKQSDPAVLEEKETLYSNIAENVSKDSVKVSPEHENIIKNNDDTFIPKIDEEDINKLENTDFGRVIDMNIECAAETKDSIEEDSDKHNKSSEPITKKIEFKSASEKADNLPKNLKADSPEQNVQINDDILHTESLNSVENETTTSMDNDSDKNITTKQTFTKEFVSKNLLEAERIPKESIDNSVEENIESISKNYELIEKNVAQDQTAVADAINDESKGPDPVHHEQDLVNALEVEIFHEPRELNKGNNTDTIYPHTHESEDKSENISNFESDLKNTNKNEINKLPSSQKDEEKLSETAKIKSHSTDDQLTDSEVDSFECTNTNDMIFKIEGGNNIPKCYVSENSEMIDGSHVYTSDIESSNNNLSVNSSGYNSEVAEVAIGREEELNEKNVITAKMSPSSDKRVQELLELENNRISKDDIREDVQDISPSETVVYEIPMRKKEYALLLPKTMSDNIIEPTTLKNAINVSGEKTENACNIMEFNNFKHENMVTNSNAASISETCVALTTDIDSSVGYVQIIKNIDKSQEKNKSCLDNKLIENTVENITQHYPNSNFEISPVVKEQNNENKEQENVTILTNNDIEIGSETADLEERPEDVEENIRSYNSELTKKTETSTANDSAEESTIGDSNDSLMDQDVEIITRSKENNMTPSMMDLETAAVTIQKVFRTFLFKSRCSTFEDTSTDEANPNTGDDNEKEELEYPVTKERRALGISRMDTVLQTVNEEKSLSLSTDDSSTLSSAATVIQAHVRGFLARNKFNSHKTSSNASLVNSDGPSTQSFEVDEQQKKTVLNIHIIPEGDHFLSRDESLITSMDLSLDGTPPSSVNLHPLGYDKSEPRKQLKREDAIQSISPPSNNSGKLSEDVDSVKEMVINDLVDPINVSRTDTDMDNNSSPSKSNTLETVVETIKEESLAFSEPENGVQEADLQCKRTLTKMSSDEGDVVTPFEKGRRSSIDSDRTSCLLHSGEFHDIVLPTKITRSDTSVVREFKNVLVYFLIWNT